MVDAEVRALCALKQDPFPTPDRLVEPCGRVRDERRETCAELDLFLVECLQIEAFRPPVGIDEPLLDRYHRLELLSEGEGIDEVAHPDSETAHLVLERGTDSLEASCRLPGCLSVSPRGRR